MPRFRTSFRAWLLVGLLLGLGLTSRVWAQAVPDPVIPHGVPQVVDDMHDYFAKEMRGGIVLVAMGAPSVALGGGLLAQDRPLLRGFAYPMIIVGALELGGGILFAARAPKQVRDLENGFAKDPLVTQKQELQRMRRVNRQFSLLEVVEVTLHLGGIGMSALGGNLRNETLSGVGIGLSVQSMGLLLFDLLAAQRALRFTESLRKMGS